MVQIFRNLFQPAIWRGYMTPRRRGRVQDQVFFGEPKEYVLPAHHRPPLHEGVEIEAEDRVGWRASTAVGVGSF